MEDQTLFLFGKKIGEIKNDCFVTWRNRKHEFHIFNNGFGLSQKVIDFLIFNQIDDVFIIFENNLLYHATIAIFLSHGENWNNTMEKDDMQIILPIEFFEVVKDYEVIKVDKINQQGHL